jgi:alanine-glyoxylate transaminase / serine-glyoxylate transaminase / serine-pyruvate transaminase
MSVRRGRHFLQIPGPSNSPDRILHALGQPTMDHRGPDFALLGKEVLGGMRKIFQTEHPVVIYPSSGTGAWEAALVNLFNPGDTLLMVETGQFASLWQELAERLGYKTEFIEGDWRHGVQAEQVEARLKADKAGAIRAVCMVHNETSTGATSHVEQVRKAIDAADHEALFLVDTISGLASMDYRHDAWGVDVSISGSQKGLMVPPGLSFNALSPRALEAYKSAMVPRSYWDWGPMLSMNENGYFPYTPSTNLLFGLKEAIDMLLEEGLDNVFARHFRLGEATRRAAQAWGLDVQCENPDERSNVLTAIRLPDGHDADALRAVILKQFDVSLGNGLGKIKGKVFRIGHLGDFNEPMLLGTLGAVEAGLKLAGVPHQAGGVDAAMRYLADTSK